MFVWHIDRAEGEALSGGQADAFEPPVQLDVTDARPIRRASDARRPGHIPSRSTDAREARRNELLVVGVEVQVSTRREAAVRGHDTYRVGKVGGPSKWSRSVEHPPRRDPVWPSRPASGHSVLRDARIVRRLAALGPALAFALRHTLLCADTESRVKGSVQVTRRSKRVTA